MARSRFFRYVEGEVVEVQKQAPKNRPKYPIACETLAVHPDQIGEARAFDKSQGLSVEYRDDGTPIMEDSAQYKRYRKAHGWHFKNGYES